MPPLGIPLCGWRVGQEFPGQPEQGVLNLCHQEVITWVFELIAELPDLRAQPQGAGLAARAEEGTPLTKVLEQLGQSSTSLHLSSAVSWANRSRTSSKVPS